MENHAEKYLKLLAQRRTFPDPLTTAKIESILTLGELMDEIFENPNTPTRIVDLAKIYKQKIFTERDLMVEFANSLEQEQSN